ncbi:hypothetical protein [Catalinimonas niigatensis]|uniref:hypothetical protein n=1 Tax=Catalinimonas niigatensis TaxID=1397264 RepID=UPI002664EC61|nr:hypothetical protein [Catalinimonas niigatensis]WPP52407.1 hypothetical protein PZB72_08430 [Catalinimonas niigatensis]
MLKYKVTFRINTVGKIRGMISTILFMFAFIEGISKFHEVSGMRILFILTGLALLSIILFHFTIGVMLISIKGDQIHFTWEKKPLFDYRNMESIAFRDIRKVVVDQGQIIKKIQTPNSGIRIESFRMNSFFQDDT